jgi:glycopeptide antibiotics resistance protein
MVPGGIIWMAWPLVAGVVVFWRVRRRDTINQVLVAVGLVTYAWWICSVAFFPVPLSTLAAENAALWGGDSPVNLVPFREMLRTMSHLGVWPLVRQFGGNALLLVPFTALGPLLWSRLRTWWWPLTVGLGGSMAIELIQLAVSGSLGYPYRRTDIDDVILNSAGAFLGYALFLLMQRAKAGRRVSPTGP